MTDRKTETNRKPDACPDCESVDRRHFLGAVGGTALAGALAPLPGAFAGLTADHAAETAVGELYATLSDSQKKVICLPFNHQLRQRVSANWHVTEPSIGDDFYTDAQRDLARRIVKELSSEDGYERLLLQMDDDSGGIEDYSMAIFGTPGTDQFEWELTGRHLTLRCDGNTVANRAFGGPIVYGHQDEDPDANLFHYQTKQVNKVFQALDPKQSKQALVAKAPAENAVKLQGAKGTFPGLSVSELSGDQKALVEESLKVLLAPFREEDVKEVMETVKGSGGIEKLHMAFYQQGDLKNDKVWDIWRVEGPSFVWHFRGAPHVHAYINVGTVEPAPRRRRQRRR